ncbi:MAG: hypothetical protein ACLUE8_07305 [Lachnospiraceae bacterium]
MVTSAVIAGRQGQIIRPSNWGFTPRMGLRNGGSVHAELVSQLFWLRRAIASGRSPSGGSVLRAR